MKRRILISSFEPFEKMSTNSSQLVAEHLKPNLPEMAWTHLPVSRNSWASLERAIQVHKPEFVIALGQAESRDSIYIEKAALNWLDFRIADNAGDQPRNQAIDPLASVSLCTSLDVERLQNRAGEGVRVSHFAGTFICNYLYFQMLRHQSLFNYQSLFLHLPLCFEQDQSPEHTSVTILGEKIRRILEAL